MSKSNKFTVQEREISFLSHGDNDFLSLTDIAKYRSNYDPNDVIRNWMRGKSTIAFLGLWEILNNSDFKPVEFDGFKSEAGYNYFVLSPQKWIEKTNAKGIISKSGRYGGTFAHKDIAFEFASWISSEFKLYLITEFQKLKNEENDRLSLNWSFQRTLAKVNYRIHADAITEKIIPLELTKEQSAMIYASEADMLNVALFGKTAQEWKNGNCNLEGNIRDHATLEQLVVLSNMESLNSVMIHQGLPQKDRIAQLNLTAIMQLKSLLNNKSLKRLQNP
ncbi:KilA-N domain-containing protein [Pedobacter hiemivivus]|uniref:KilA-N domain-containing protein n=1 Tax=Pedobacter hiemivivus TaxID=2530454 RepID=A0A4R0NEN0_9SPHI|nr:KilA-N domain-containing protein [Pedobacter hiemivivus]TCC97034.1 KilA-N domain-containing protein [Pedobacter hiemivivus]